MKNIVYIGCPNYGGLHPRMVTSLHQATKEEGGDTLAIYRIRDPDSLLCWAFNNLWCEALNNRKIWGITEWCMMHSDMEVVEAGWVEIMIAERKRLGLDVLAANVPIKDESGTTSTAIHDPESMWTRRLTQAEVHKQPTTFTRDDVCTGKQILFANTGLWVCDFTKPWVEKVFFSIRDQIVQMEDGRFVPRVLPEDWHFSLQCHNLGVKIGITRCVTPVHHGGGKFRGDQIWGSPVDPEFRPPLGPISALRGPG